MRCGVGTALGGHQLPPLLLAALLAVPASGDTIKVFFDGPVVDDEQKGVSAPNGAPVMDFDVFQVTGALSVANQSGNGSVVGEGSLNEIDSLWAVQNDYGAFPGDVFLLFSTAINRQITTTSGTFTTGYDTDYTDEPPGNPISGNHVGLIIDPADGWIFVESEIDVMGTLTTVYYPGIALGDFANIGAECGTDPATNDPILLADSQTCVAVTYFLENPGAGLFQDGPNQVLGLPELRILMAVIPEPATGSLLGLGLATLAAIRRRRR